MNIKYSTQKLKTPRSGLRFVNSDSVFVKIMLEDIGNGKASMCSVDSRYANDKGRWAIGQGVYYCDKESIKGWYEVFKQYERDSKDPNIGVFIEY
jgi:hypothetical protein